MQHHWISGLVVTALAGLVHCSPSAGSTVSCAQVTQSGPITIRQCVESSGLTADQEAALAMSCRSSDAGTIGDTGLSLGITAMFQRARCDRTDALGGCRMASGEFMTTIWYYRGGAFADATIVRQTCATANGAWVDP
jgi:hypothetical protein